MLTYEERIILKRLVSQARYEKLRAHDPLCAQCGQPYAAPDSRKMQQRYCSLECRARANNERVKAAQKAKRRMARLEREKVAA